MLYSLLWVTAGACLQAVTCATFSLLVALPGAYYLYRYTFPGRSWCIALLYLCSILPTKVAALAINLWYHVDGLPGIILGLSLINMPFALLFMYLVYSRIDVTSTHIAAQLGASEWRVYKDIVFAQTKHNAQALFATIFILCFCAVSFSLLLGSQPYHATPDVMMDKAYQAGAMTDFWLYAIIRICVLTGISWSGFTSPHSYNVPIHIDQQHRLQQYYPRYHGWLGVVLLIGIIIFTIGPLTAFFAAGITHMVGHFMLHVLQGMHDPHIGMPVIRVLGNSIMIGAFSSIVTVFVSWLLCWASGRAGYGTSWSTFIALAPFFMGSVGCGVLFNYLADTAYLTTWLALLLSHVIINYPFAYRLLSARYCSYDPEWTKSAQSLGATVWHIRKTVQYTFMRPAFIHALCLVFSLSLTEVGAGSVMRGNAYLTLPAAIRLYRAAGIEQGVIGMTALLCIIVMITAGCAVYAQRK